MTRTDAGWRPPVTVIHGPLDDRVAAGNLRCFRTFEANAVNTLIVRFKNTSTYEGAWQNNRPSPMNPKNRFVENIFEKLDAPGEWFHDGKTSTLYYMPSADVDCESRPPIHAI